MASLVKHYHTFSDGDSKNGLLESFGQSVWYGSSDDYRLDLDTVLPSIMNSLARR